jgi:hypothetical protein
MGRLLSACYEEIRKQTGRVVAVTKFRREMNPQPQQVSDETLWQMLDTRCPWLVRTEDELLRPQHNLREALWQAWNAKDDGKIVISILKLPEKDTVIEAPQVRRLALRLVQISQTK